MAVPGIINDFTSSVAESAVTTSVTIAKAGEVEFAITNDGTLGHEFLVVKTELAPGKIPLDGDHFAEPTDGIDEIGEFAVGTTESLTVNLEAGN